MQEFKIDKNYITIMKVCLAVFIAFLALGFALPFLTDEEVKNTNGTLFATLMCTVVFGSFSMLTWHILRKLPFADIASDDDGIWYIHLGKDNGLISWKKVSEVKERSYLQCLDLLDRNGERLLRVEYQLIGFEVIRHTINERTPNTNATLSQSEFSKGPMHHPFYLASVFGFSALGIYVGSDGSPLVGYGGMSVVVALIIHEYFVTATGVNIDNSLFEIVYPFAKRNVLFSDIEDIFIADEFHQGKRIPEVWIISKKTIKPFKLKDLGADSNILCKALRKAAKI
jgi:hypothetical protein